MKSIPLFDYPSFQETVSLDGVKYQIKINYNVRGGYWTISIYDSKGTAILEGMKLVIDTELLSIHGGLIPGRLIVTSEFALNPVGRDDFGKIILAYIPESEAIAAGA